MTFKREVVPKVVNRSLWSPDDSPIALPCACMPGTRRALGDTCAPRDLRCLPTDGTWKPPGRSHEFNSSHLCVVASPKFPASDARVSPLAVLVAVWGLGVKESGRG